MSVQIEANGIIRLHGVCSLDDAERLLQLLLTHTAASIDWSDCEGAHTAVVQLLRAAGRPLKGQPRDAFLARHVRPALRRLETAA